jgi:hypothetical protein
MRFKPPKSWRQSFRKRLPGAPFSGAQSGPFQTVKFIGSGAMESGGKAVTGDVFFPGAEAW